VFTKSKSVVIELPKILMINKHFWIY